MDARHLWILERRRLESKLKIISTIHGGQAQLETHTIVLVENPREAIGGGMSRVGSAGVAGLALSASHTELAAQYPRLNMLVVVYLAAAAAAATACACVRAHVACKCVHW
jgi:hypothetical protein